jgi:antitoxin CptB
VAAGLSGGYIRALMTDDTLQTRLARARFRAWRRGFREADLILGPFVDAEGSDLDAGELEAFEALLDQDDHQLYAWILGNAPTPAPHDGPVMARIRAFMAEHVAAAVAEGAG